MLGLLRATHGRPYGGYFVAFRIKKRSGNPERLIYSYTRGLTDRPTPRAPSPVWQDTPIERSS